jgi:hypothetical protein
MLLASCSVIKQGLEPRRPVPASENREDIVYLNDGRTLRGTIVERVPGTSLSLRTRQGMVWVLQEAQIRRVQDRSLRAATAPGTPVVHISDSDLAGRYVHITANGIGTREGRVVRSDADTIVMKRTALLGRATRIPRAAISSVLVSTSQRKRPELVAYVALAGAVAMGLSTWALEASNPTEGVDPGSDALVGAAGGAVFGAVAAAPFAFLRVEHGEWRRLDLRPTPTAPPVGSTRVQVGVRVPR